ncbi:FeoB-associated Cys-rich membrane protein [Limnoglobus roseus]|uniref:FeoB-associated Cys-rich membrane protein n=1 Tax=Limnoglobus roseus TaxID=2598579 RepID=A0A5C1AEQ6_9BACT|nr:FeoB-associated Cys-rich membrane protein [Limnoglobus roseus]QEL15518.1 hypothetical protein PX52LOC_02442 [Limnoglobus roseus]
MDGQLAVVTILLLLAGGYVLRATWRAVRGTPGGCASGCGKCAPADEPKPGRVSLPQVK